MNTREKVLKEALNCVNGEREKQYGNPEDNFRRIADLWSVYLTSLFEGETVVIELDPIDVAKMMILFKIARSNGDLDKLDNYVDIIGYGACAAEILEKDMGFSKKYQKEEWKDFADKMAEKPSDNNELLKKLNEAEDCYKYFMEKNFSKNPYSWYHDQLAKYVSYRAKRKHIPLDGLKAINRKFPRELEKLLDQESTDCAINGKRLFDCYEEIDELFDKYDIPDKSEDEVPPVKFNHQNSDSNVIGHAIIDSEGIHLNIIKPENVDKKDVMTKIINKKTYASFRQAYESIILFITSSSKKANISYLDVIDYLAKKKYCPAELAFLLYTDKLSFDDITTYVNNAINELNTFYDDKLRGVTK